MANILVTGGAGYIGIELCRQLIEKGHSVTIVDLCFFGEKALEVLDGRYKLIKEDIREPRKEWFEGIDYVCHLAGFSNDPMAAFNPNANMEINHIGTVRVAELAKERGVKKFVFASSASVYDKGLVENHDVMYFEDSEVDPLPTYYYSIAKVRAENDLKSMASKDFSVYVLRQGTIFGWSEKMRYDLVVNTMIKTAICEGKMNVFHGGVMWRPLVDVSDCARAYIACMEIHHPNEVDYFNIFNIVQENYRILDLAHYIKHELKQEGMDVEVNVLYSNEPQRSYRMSGARIEKALSFKPLIDVRTSVRKIILEMKNKNMNNQKTLHNPMYYNIEWMKHLEEIKKILKHADRILD
ncbi:MAG: SDR family oxidoreductase [archaeon]